VWKNLFDAALKKTASVSTGVGVSLSAGRSSVLSLCFSLVLFNDEGFEIFPTFLKYVLCFVNFNFYWLFFLVRVGSLDLIEGGEVSEWATDRRPGTRFRELYGQPLISMPLTPPLVLLSRVSCQFTSTSQSIKTSCPMVAISVTRLCPRPPRTRLVGSSDGWHLVASLIVQFKGTVEILALPDIFLGQEQS
jgi:hypothetical protein